MARTVRYAALESRNSRLSLRARSKPYWRAISQGRHIGYRKGKKGGTWLARLYLGEGRYKEREIGPADDVMDADGVTVFTFAQAQTRAREWFEAKAREVSGEHSGTYTVDQALDDYLSWYEANRRDIYNARHRSRLYIRPALGSIEVARLTAPRIREWHQGLASSRPRVRSGKGKPVQYRATSDDPEDKRKRKAFANKVLTLLKAALNHAWREGRVPSDDAWRRVRPFPNVDVPRVRYLQVAEAKRLVNASAADFRKLVQGALLTGCRYGELAAMRCGDFNADVGSVHVTTSKSGKSRYVALSDEGQRFFEQVTAGCPSNARMFLRANGQPWKKSEQARPLAEACKRAKIEPAINFHVLRHTYASHLVMGGAPLSVVAANLGHSDTRMVEKHYAHLAPSFVTQTIRKVSPRYGIVPRSRVARLDRGQRLRA